MTQATRDFDELFTFTRASTATYFDANGVMQTAAIDEPRFDHDPVTGESKGVLVEKESTNHLLHSEDLSVVAVWKLYTISTSFDSEIAPDGTLTADVIEPSGTGVYQISSVTGGTTYTASVWVKLINASQNQIGIYDDTNSTWIVDVATNVTAATTEWTRVSVTFTAPSTSNSVRFYICRGNVDKGSQALWGAQLEQGDVATSYIPTAGTAVTRSADSLIHDVGVRYNEPEGTWIVKANSYESTILDNVGFTTAKFTGDGTIVYRYDSTGGYFYANGQKEFNTAKPSTIDTFNIGAGGTYQWTNDLVYYPYAISEADAIALTTGSVTVDWFYPDDQSLILDFAQKKYGTRNISDAMDVTETTDFSTLLTFSRSSTARYFDSTGIMQEAANDELRFDYDANTGESLGILMEGGRTNLVLLSEDLTTVPWGNYGASISANATTAPDGAATADKLVEDTADDVHQRGISEVDYTTPMSFSIFAKAAERTQATLICAGVESGIIDLQTGTTSDPDVIITPAGNGWWRLAMTKTPADGTAKVYGIGMAVGGVSSYVGDGSSGLYAWGAQLEEQSWPSSYIQTTGSAASRSDDILAFSLSNEFNPSGSTIVLDYIRYNPMNAFAFSYGGNTSNYIGLDYAKDSIAYVQPTNANIELSGASELLGSHTVAVSVDEKTDPSVIVARDGSSTTEQGSGTLTTDSYTQLRIGYSHFSSALVADGHYKRIDYIPYALTASQLETLTT